MTDKQYEAWNIADSTEMDKRKHIAQDFYNRILEPEDRYAYCADVDCLYDIVAYDADDECWYDIFIDEKKIKEKILHHYGQIVTQYELSTTPFWKLLDRLYRTNLSLPKS